MSSRRKFLLHSAVSSFAVVAGAKLRAAANTNVFTRNASGSADRNIPSAAAPVVISTWDFGQPANQGAWEVLSKNGRALDAVEAGVRVSEADPNNHYVGYGAFPDRDGNVTLDACIMDENYNCGSVMCLTNIVHAISVARLVMEKTPHIILTGEGAEQFALANGFPKQNLLTPESEKAWKEWLKTSDYKPGVNVENSTSFYPMELPGGKINHDTIGMVALDAQGNLSGACTTSGLAYKMHGRVGDSPVIGAGLYVDNEAGAATSTGVGEEVIRIVGTHLVVEFMRQGASPEAACRKAVERIAHCNPERAKKVQVGFLALNKKGVIGAFALQKGFTYAVKNGKEDRLYSAKSLYS